MFDHFASTEFMLRTYTLFFFHIVIVCVFMFRTSYLKSVPVSTCRVQHQIRVCSFSKRNSTHIFFLILSSFTHPHVTANLVYMTFFLLWNTKREILKTCDGLFFPHNFNECELIHLNQK